MSTPPNPPSTPVEPPTEPADTPIPETASVPAPAQPLSLDKTPAPAAPEAPAASAAPEASATSEPPAPADAPAAPAPAASATPVAPAAAEAPAAPAAPTAPEAPAAPVDSAAPQAPAAPAPSQFAPPAPSPFATPAPGSTSPFASPAPGTTSPFPMPAPGAPTVPVAPTAPGMPGAPAWGQPGFGAGPYGGYPQPKAPTNGLAVAAVIVASLGVMAAVVPFFFWLGALMAVVATGLGIGGVVRANKGAPNKTMAVVGTVLGVLGLAASVGGFFLTAAIIEDTPSRYERGIDIGEDDMDLEGLYPSGEPWPSASRSPSQVPGLTSALPFGETFTYPNGVKVTLSAPTKYEPKGIIARERVKNAIQLTITITNGSSSPHEVIYAVPSVRDEHGMTADMVFDSSGSGGRVPKMIEGSILPGASASGVVAFELPEGTKSITANISAGTRLEDVKYAGPIG